MSEEYQVHLFDKLQDMRGVYTEPGINANYYGKLISHWSIGVAKCDHERYKRFYGEELPEHAERFYGCCTGNIVVEKIVNPVGETIYSEI